MKKKTAHPDVLMEVLALVHRTVPVGHEVTNEAWNHAYAMIRAGHELDTITWKFKHMTIGEYKR